MADILNSNEIFYTQWQPTVQNRFELYVDGVPSFLIYKSTLPKAKIEKKTIDYINIQRYYAGKTTWDNITLELYNPIVPSGAQAMIEWLRLAHESVTGRDGYSDFYKKDLVLNLLGPLGDKVSEWKLVGAFPVNIDWGEVDWTNDGDQVKITVELSVDYCVLQY
jgi:T4-like virus tail tube protein gp19